MMARQCYKCYGGNIHRIRRLRRLSKGGSAELNCEAGIVLTEGTACAQRQEGETLRTGK